MTHGGLTNSGFAGHLRGGQGEVVIMPPFLVSKDLPQSRKSLKEYAVALTEPMILSRLETAGGARGSHDSHIGALRSNVVTYCYGRALYNQSVTSIMKAHRYVRQVERNELSEFELPHLRSHGVPRSRSLPHRRRQAGHPVYGGNGRDRHRCGSLRAPGLRGSDRPSYAAHQRTPGRSTLRLWAHWPARLTRRKTGGGQQLRLRAIVVRPSKVENDLSAQASCVGIRCMGDLTAPFGSMKKTRPSCQRQRDPHDLRSDPAVDYEAYGIRNAIVIDNTGAWRDDGTWAAPKAKGAPRPS